jgi:hypothetical protein
MVNFEAGFKRPFNDVGKLILGIVLSIIPIVNFIAIGYGFRCIKTVLGKKKKYALPEWKEWGDLFFKGLAVGVIGVIYALPGILVIMYLMFKFFLSAGVFENMTALQDPLTLLLTFVETNLTLVVLTGVLLLIASFISPLAIVNYAKKGSFGAAFSFGEIFSKISGTYVGVWVIAGIYNLILIKVLGYIPLVGMGIASFIVMVTTYTWFGEAYSSA